MYEKYNLTFAHLPPRSITKASSPPRMRLLLDSASNEIPEAKAHGHIGAEHHERTAVRCIYRDGQPLGKVHHGHQAPGLRVPQTRGNTISTGLVAVDNPMCLFPERALNKILESEVADHVGAERYERIPVRRTYRNGNRLELIFKGVAPISWRPLR